jgi:hypothetical protein
MKRSNDAGLQILGAVESAAEQAPGPALDFVNEGGLLGIRGDALLHERQHRLTRASLPIFLVGRRERRARRDCPVVLTEDQEDNVAIAHAS